MKKIIVSSIITLFLVLCFQDCATYQTQSSSNENQYDGYNLADLNDYGEWVQTGYGQAWKPYVADGWQPFDYGYWTYADNNWTWISYEPFGWIVYHYGNWYDDPFYGWVWLPASNAWSPARVEWMHYGDYIAWAPMPPGRVAYGNPWEANQDRYWHVVKSQDFTNDNVHNYRVEASTIRNNNGDRNSAERTPPSVQAIRNSTNKPVPEVKLQRQQIKLPRRNVERTVLPPQDEKKVEDNSARVRKNVLVPRDEYKKKEPDQNKQKPTNQDNNRGRDQNSQPDRNQNNRQTERNNQGGRR
jgi:Family of unknown function (DUF6600)